LALALLLCALTAGCGPESIETRYGVRKGYGSDSVNGTAVLGEMFEQAGHRVVTTGTLSPGLKRRADCIVWFPDDFQPPDPVTRRWFDQWLMERPNRTLIYVGRDFDAGVAYWKKVLPTAPASQAPLIRDEIAHHESAFDGRRTDLPDEEDCEWFTVEGQLQHRNVRALAGTPEWTRDVDPTKLEIELNGRIEPALMADVLLESKGDMLVSREARGRGQLIVVTNGSFLVNLQLINHEHRKLAGKLIDEVGPPEQTAVFLESGPGGPTFADEEIEPRPPSGLALLTQSPTSWIFRHLALLGILFCAARWPIFGRPRELPPPGTSDFGTHIRALAEMLQRSRDTAFAMTRLMHYRQKTKGGD